MRLPRFRITVGSLLFAVAIVALNCWVYRAVETWEHHGPGNHALWRLDPEEILVFLPLINVSAIGSCLVLKKWIRKPRSRPGAVDSSVPPAMTFFCLNFLAIGYLAFNFMEEKVGRFLRPAAYWVSSGLDWLESWVGWEILDSHVEDFLLGLVLVSGPLLVLAWIGRVIARRAASKLSKRRFLAVSALVSLGFAAVALSIVLPLRPFNGSGDFDLEFRVVDQESGQPIEGASVRITGASDADDMGNESGSKLTAHDGRTRLSCRFRASGERNAFQTIGTFSTGEHWLEVSAKDHRTSIIPLPESVGPEIEIGRVPRKEIALTRGQTPVDALQDIAGSYQANIPSRFEIQADGRFYWSASGCSSTASEYGFVKRVGDQIEFLPVPNPVETTHPYLSLKFRTILWDDCLYLTSTEPEAIRDFCKAALTPERNRRTRHPYRAYLRESDFEKIPRGFPPLPLSAWVEFVAFEVNLKNKSSDLRQALESFVKQNFWPESREARREREEKYLAQLLQAPEVVKAP